MSGFDEKEFKCFVCKKALKKEEALEEICTSGCGIDIIVFCRECYKLR